MRSSQDIEKDHDRIETREYWIVTETSFEAASEWRGPRAIGMVKSERIFDGVPWSKTRHYIRSRMMRAQAFAKS